MQRVLVTGANRGLGLAWVRHLAARGDEVFATCRRPEAAAALQALAEQEEKVHLLPMDVADEESIRTACAQIRRQGAVLDTVINNAGVLYEHETVDTLRPEHLLHACRVNAVGPMLVARAALPLLRPAPRPVIFNVSTMLASLTLKTFSGYYSYSASKAALNMLTRTLAAELRPQGIIVVAVHPGWVRTDMGGPQAPLSPQASVEGMSALLERLTMAHSGRFWTWEGKEHPW